MNHGLIKFAFICTPSNDHNHTKQLALTRAVLTKSPKIGKQTHCDHKVHANWTHNNQITHLQVSMYTYIILHIDNGSTLPSHSYVTLNEDNYQSCTKPGNMTIVHKSDESAPQHIHTITHELMDPPSITLCAWHCLRRGPKCFFGVEQKEQATHTHIDCSYTGITWYQ